MEVSSVPRLGRSVRARIGRLMVGWMDGWERTGRLYGRVVDEVR